MAEYNTNSEEFISQKISQDLQEYLFPVLSNLSTVLGDSNSRISYPIKNTLLTYIVLKPPGKLVSLKDEVKDSLTEYEEVLGDEPYYVDFTYSATQWFGRMSRRSYQTIGENISPLLHEEDIPEDLRPAQSGIYLGTMDLYLNLLEFSSTGILGMSKQAVVRIEHNVRWLSSRLDPNTHYKSIIVLRYLHQTLLGILKLKFLF